MLSFSALKRDQIQLLLYQAMCPHCMPQKVPETLAHPLLACPVDFQVWDWVSRLWSVFAETTPPPVTAGGRSDTLAAFSEPAECMGTAQDGHSSCFQLESPRQEDGSSFHFCLCGLSGCPLQQDSYLQRLPASLGWRPSTACQRGLLLLLAQSQAPVSLSASFLGSLGQHLGFVFGDGAQEQSMPEHSAVPGCGTRLASTARPLLCSSRCLV